METIQLKLPIGRLIQGSLYKTYEQKKDDGSLEFYHFFGLAIPKEPGKHWSKTEWGSQIYNLGMSAFPKRDPAAMSWKIINGDSTIVPAKAKLAPSDYEGAKNSWILKFRSPKDYVIKIVDRYGKKDHTNVPNMVNLGDFIQVYVRVVPNDATGNGVYINPLAVSFVAYGPPIRREISVESMGFGSDPLPDGASETPIDVQPYREILNQTPPKSEFSGPLVSVDDDDIPF